MNRLTAPLAAAAITWPLALASNAAAAPLPRCQPVTAAHFNTITVTRLCPPAVRVQLALVTLVTGGGENQQTEHNVVEHTARARHGAVTFTNLQRTLWEWRTIRGRHTSAWTIVQLT